MSKTKLTRLFDVGYKNYFGSEEALGQLCYFIRLQIWTNSCPKSELNIGC